MNPGWPFIETLCKAIGIDNTEMIVSFHLHHEVDEIPRVTIERIFLDVDLDDVVTVFEQYEVVRKDEEPE